MNELTSKYSKTMWRILEALLKDTKYNQRKDKAIILDRRILYSWNTISLCDKFNFIPMKSSIFSFLRKRQTDTKRCIKKWNNQK